MPTSLRQRIIITLTNILLYMNPDVLLPDWSIIPAAHHNVRAICDLEGLDHEQKQILTACVYVESGFDINAVHYNKNGQGEITSTDFGIVQVNDYWHIGSGKDFPTVDYVMSHPEECVRWMARYYKQHGNLNAWVSFSAGLYQKYLGKV